MTDLSIIIINYNVTRLLEECLVSIEENRGNISLEVIVVDNNSEDKSWKDLIAVFPEVKFLSREKNEGFAVANNFGVRQAKGKNILLLNPDTVILDKNMFSEIISFADNLPSMGCLGVRFEDGNGNFLPECKRSVPNIIYSFQKLFINKNSNRKNYYRSDIPEYNISEVEVITGAFMLMKKEVYQKVGGLDEQYFMYGEDIDLCYTLLQEGYVNYYYGKYTIVHYKGESTVKDKKYLERFYGAMGIFLDKYYKKNILIYYFLKVGLFAKHQLEILKIKNST